MIKIIASLVILFVAVNLVMTIYHSVNKKMREGLENMDKKKNIPGETKEPEWCSIDEKIVKKDPSKCNTIVELEQWKGKKLSEVCPSICPDHTKKHHEKHHKKHHEKHHKKHHEKHHEKHTNRHSESSWEPTEDYKSNKSSHDFAAMGRKFARDEANMKGIAAPKISDSEAENLGRQVWRVYKSEQKESKAKNEKKARAETMKLETELVDTFAELVRSHSEDNKRKHKKHSIYKNSKSLNGEKQSVSHTNHRTTGIMTHTGTYYPTQKHHFSTVHNYMISGDNLSGHEVYSDSSIAMDKCANDENCGGVNRTHSGDYTLMPTGSVLHPKHGSKAHVKSAQYLPHSHDKQTHYKFKTGHPRDPRLNPKPYNSLMDLFR